MSLVFEKTKEVTRTLLPVVTLVMILCFTIVDVETDVIIRFIVGSVMFLIGLSIFLWGVDLAMNPIGENMSHEIATSRSLYKISLLSFFLGFLVTVAEPDLLVLGSQVEAASGGTMSATLIVYIISIGVGVMVSLGVLRLLRDKPLNVFMAMTYGIIFVLTLLVSEEYLAISFDASGATTGALTTPFVLAISLGLSKVKGGKKTEENSFGLVGIMSAGPILAVMLMSILSRQKNIQGDAGEYVVAEGVLEPIINAIPTIFFESVIALLPIALLFFIYNFRKFKLPKDELSGIIKGLAFTLLGLTLFLTAVNSGFLDMGRIIGMKLAKMSHWILIGVGFLIGLIVVLVEPAVHVLGEQIEEVTSGHIPLNLIRMTLSIGVAIAIALSMVRIVVPEVKLWYFIIPGFAIAILLSFISDPIFVGIAYDAGGVASGPMTATFVLAFAQGAASVIDTADVLVDGFGVIAMVAMAPVFSITLLGTVFKHKKVEYPVIEKKEVKTSHLIEEGNIQHDCIMAVVNRGFAEKVVEVARQSGATGATIIRGRGTDEHQKVLLPIINIELQPEKEIVLLITGTHISTPVADSLLCDSQLDQDGEISVFISPTEAMVKPLTTEKNMDDIESET
ncbi:MAG: DUF1538 domain-containing protein [Bacillota bacterium]